jgi:hypothetical protein
MLGVLLHVPRGPFYSPKATRSRWEQSRKANLAFCRLVHRTVRCRFLSCSGAADRWRFGTVGSPDSPVHHRTVRWILAVRCWLDSQERRLRHSRLTGQSGAPPDSPLIYIRTTPSRPESRQFTRHQSGAPDTIRCTTGQSGAPRLSRILAARAKSFPFVISLILALRQIC